MDLAHTSLEDCLISAWKGEIESELVYSRLADVVKNAFLKDRLRFLALEEKRHQQVFEHWFKEECDDSPVKFPDKAAVPLPEIILRGTRILVSEVIQQAMRAEEAAADFYRSMAEKFPLDDERKRALLYIASMERGHYRLLEIELENVEMREDQNFEWPMMHVGP
jgi:rubrerythrin